MIAETYYDLVTNQAHWLFEITGEVVTAIVMFPFARAYQRWHDRKHHGHPPQNKTCDCGRFTATAPFQHATNCAAFEPRQMPSGHPDDWTPEEWVDWTKRDVRRER